MILSYSKRRRGLLSTRQGNGAVHAPACRLEPLEGRTLMSVTVISEDFSAGAANFTPDGGTWSASGGAYRATAAGTASTTHLNTRSIQRTTVDGNFSFSADASVVGTTSGWNDFAVVFGYQDANNYYFFSSNESNDTGTNGLFRVVNGVSTELADASGTITAGTTYRARVDRVGAQINAYRNGQLVATASDSRFLSGRVGFGSKGDQGAFDNLVVTQDDPASPPPPATIEEDFTTTAGGMSPVDGTWAVSNGTYQATAPGTASAPLNTRSVHATAVSGDFTLDADASVTDTASAWNDFAVVFGYQDANNYYFFSSNESNDGGTNGLFKVVNGTITELADAAGTITAGATYHVRVERLGDRISAYRNGALVATAADSTFPSGKVGFGTRGDSATFDNLVVAGTAAPSPVAPPAAPSGLAATPASPAQINLAWGDNSSDEAGFKVERSTDGVTFAQVATVGPDVKAYAATGLSPSTSYTFRVRAFNAAGDSAYSNAAAASTPAAPSGDTLGPYTRPSAATAGLTDPSLLVRRTGTWSTTAAGQVVENVEFSGGIVYVLHDNVTFRNCRFTNGADLWAGTNEGAARSGVVVDHCEFVNTGGLGRGISLYRCYVHGLRDSDFWRNPGDCTWEGNYFTDVYATSSTPHIDMIQWYWSNPAQRVSAANLTVRGNYWNVDNAYSYANQFNAILFNDMNMTDITWDYNWMKSGGYVIRTNNAARVSFTGNAFEGWGWGPMLTMGGYSNIGFTGNQILRNGSLQPFEKPPGANSDLWGNT